MRFHAAFLFLLTFAAADGEIERLMQANGVPGAAIVVVKDGNVVHSKTFGVTSVETQVPVTPKTLFRLGSTAKMFTALAALRLAEEDKLKLEQPIGELINDLPPKLKPLTLEQLLTHTAGLAEESPMVGPLEEAALHERVKGLGDGAFYTEPGQIFSYANNGYIVAGDVIAHVTKKPFSEAIRALVLEPLGMNDSTYRPLEAFTHSVALGHDKDASGKTIVARPFAEHAGAYPPGSLFTSIEDLSKAFAKLPLDKLAKPRTEIVGQHRHYGYGVVVDDNRGPRLVLHTGARVGYGSIFLFLPEQRVAVAILANKSGAVFSSAAFIAIDQFAETSEPAKLRADLPLSPDEAKKIAGLYTNGSLKVELAVDDGKLVLKLANRNVPVQRTGPWTFHIENGRQLEDFVIVPDPSGAPRYLAADVGALQKRN